MSRHSPTLARRMLLASVALSGALSVALLHTACRSAELPFATMEREAYSSLEAANRAASRLDYEGATTYFDRACAQFAAIDATNGLLLCQINLAALHIKTGKTQAAVEILNHVSRMAERHGLLHLRGTARLYLAFVRLGAREYEAALREVDAGLADVKEREEKRRGLQYRAEALLETGKVDACIQAAEESMGSNTPGRDSYAHSLVARAHMKRSHWDEAIRSMERAARLDRDHGLSDLLAYDYELLSTLHEKADHAAAAIDFADRALNVNLAINRYEPSRRLIKRLIGLQQNGGRDATEIDRLNRTLKRIERLR